MLFSKRVLVALSFFTAASPLFPQQIDSARVERLIQFVDSTYADQIQLYHKGQLVTNWENDRCDRETFNTASMVKSWTGLVVGILIDKKIIKSAEDKVCDYLPEWKDGCEKGVTIKNLLTMSGGLNRTGGHGIISKGDMNKHALAKQLDQAPNARFSYSNEGVQILGLLMEKVTGKTAQDLYEEVLFRPLEMNSSHLMKDSVGHYQVYGGAMTTADDAAKVGLLMLNNGQFNGKQVVSKEWIEATTTSSELAPFYGYLWWIDNQSAHKNFAAMGDFGDMTIVFPDLDLVFIRLQDCETPAGNNMTWMSSKFVKLISDTVTN